MSDEKQKAVVPNDGLSQNSKHNTENFSQKQKQR